MLEEGMVPGTGMGSAPRNYWDGFERGRHEVMDRKEAYSALVWGHWEPGLGAGRGLGCRGKARTTQRG